MTIEMLDVNKIYSYADYLKWDFKERVELIVGRLYKMSPAPSPLHQRISMDISGQLWSFLRGKECKVYTAPFDVRLAKKGMADFEIYTVVQPDISVVCDKSKIDGRGCLGAPDIVVEILSPSNNETELNNKYELYQSSGVREYWVVFPDERAVIQYSLVNEQFVGSRPLVSGHVVTSDILPGFKLDLAELFGQGN